MQDRTSKPDIATILQGAIHEQFFNEDHQSIIFYDLDQIAERIKRLKTIFPRKTLHTVAIKANPLPRILEYLKHFGVGAEGATLPEIYLAEKSGYAPDKIIFDSPAKTHQEIRYVLERGFHLNADSLQELDRINRIRRDINTQSTIGLRINPQIGTGKIEMTSTAGKYSKFGVPLDEKQNQIRSHYQKYSWLTGVHLHIGSQGNPIDQLIGGIEKVYHFVEDLNTKLGGQIKYFDIGGGFPVSYHKAEAPPDLTYFSGKLGEKCPQLFTDNYQLITEYGRSIHANSGWTATQVEYIKESQQINTAVVHVGADLLMRRCYLPDQWHHDVSVLDTNGVPKQGPKKKYNIVGPLCFSGDILHRNITLPEIKAGDFIIIHDTGAYTLSMWNRHLSRQIPLVLGYRKSGEKFTVLKQKESLEDIYQFWQ